MNEGEIAAGLAETAYYRYAERVGSQLYVAGQVPQDRHGNLTGIGDPREQAIQCLRNLKSVLSHHGFSENEIRKLTIYVVGEHENLRSAWEGVTHWFSKNVPPATLLGVTRLGYREQLVEIDVSVAAIADADS